MSPDQLRAVGTALYGPRFQRLLSADLGIAERTMRRWLAGRFAIPADVATRIKAIARERAAALARIKTLS